MKILLAVDGSAFTKHMLAYLAAHDELLGDRHEFTVLTVVPPVPPEVTHFIDRRTLDDYYAEKADAVLSPISAFIAHHSMKATAQHMVGHAAQAIADMATERKFDLIVMGSHGHSTIGSLVLGSVATGVMARCKTPVLIVR